MSAVGEAFNNIVLHAYSEELRGEVHLELSLAQDEILVTLTDQGKSFELGDISSPDGLGSSDVLELPESGMGLYIMRSFLDEVDYRPGSPNVLKLRKRVAPPAD